MSHSHIPINHLLKSLEDREPRSGDSRPTWLVELINRAATLFEPLMGVSRVGFDCWPTEDHWVVYLFLGDTETVGGHDDGRLDPPEFHFDLLGLLELLDDVETSRWTVFPTAGNESGDESGNESGDDRSFVSMTARYRGNPVCLRLLSIAPDAAGPGLRLFPNGDREPV